MEKDNYGPTVLRLVIGLLFVIPGLGKLMNPLGISAMLESMGFPMPLFWAWVLLLSEIVFGAAVLVGWQLKYVVWPLVVIMLVATFVVVLPSFGQDPMAYVNLLFHVVVIGGLLSLYLSGPGALAVKQK